MNSEVHRTFFFFKVHFSGSIKIAINESIGMRTIIPRASVLLIIHVYRITLPLIIDEDS